MKKVKDLKWRIGLMSRPGKHTNVIKLAETDPRFCDQELASNGKGYNDPTASTAITNVKLEEAIFLKLMRTIVYITDLAGFKIDCKLIMINEDTGRRWSMGK